MGSWMAAGCCSISDMYIDSLQRTKLVQSARKCHNRGQVTDRGRLLDFYYHLRLRKRNMPTASSSRPPTAAGSRSRPKVTASAKATTPDALADALATKLTIAKKPEASRTRAKVESPQQRRVVAMRAVNDASQGLSALVQSTARSKPNAAKLWESARGALRVLRELDSDGADVERAALSIVGKLVVLELVGGYLLVRVLTDISCSSMLLERR